MTAESCADAALRRAGVTRADFGNEARASAKILGPAILSNYSTVALTLINLAFVGHLGATPMAACALSTTIVGIAGLSGAMGISCALDSLCSQAHGARNPVGASHALQRALVAVTVYAVPVVVLLCCIEPDVSRIAGQFLRVLAIGLLPALWSEIVRRALYAAGISWPQLVVGASGVVAIAALNWLLVHMLGLGVIGSAVALSSSWAVQFVVLLAIVRASGYHRLVFAGGPSVEALKRGWKEMLTLAGSGYVMVCSEWWAFEILVFLAGLGGAVSLASFSTVMNLHNFTWMTPMSW
eukprot:m51a1_g12619 hypothetical protein (296) ;mRNA; f:2554-3857